jgi:hypothetical protein
MDGAGVGRLGAYFEQIGAQLPRREQRESFATYAFGILSDGERKSVEPIAARACGEPRGTQRAHDRLLHFLSDSPWSDRAVRTEAARYAIAAMSAREPVTTWIIDDTGFLKEGKHSVAVQRQYTGSAGKVTNCQIGVSLSVASRSEHARSTSPSMCRSPGAATPNGARPLAFRRRSRSRRSPSSHSTSSHSTSSHARSTTRYPARSCSPTLRTAPRSSSAMAW